MAYSKGQVNVTHISIANFLSTVTDRANVTITIIIKSYLEFQMAYSHSTLAYFRCQGQGHAHVGCKYLVNVDRQRNHAFAINIASNIFF